MLSLCDVTEREPARIPLNSLSYNAPPCGIQIAFFHGWSPGHHGLNIIVMQIRTAYKGTMWSSQVVFFSRASQVIMPFPHSAGNDLPLSEENSDLSILSVRDSSSGHESEQAPVATGFQAHLLESKLDTLTSSMLKMSDSLARLARPHGALLDSEE